MAEQKTHMEQIEALTQRYADERDELAVLVGSVHQEIERVTRAATARIKALVRSVAEAHDRLERAVLEHPELWQGKRRTVVIAGVRVGMRKSKGKITWDDPEQVVRLIRKQFPEAAETLIRTKEEPVRSALENLTAAELKKLGCEIDDTDDQVVIKPTDTQVDKLVAALLKDAERSAQDEAV